MSLVTVYHENFHVFEMELLTRNRNKCRRELLDVASLWLADLMILLAIGCGPSAVPSPNAAP